MDEIHQVPPTETLVNTFSSTRDSSSADAMDFIPRTSKLAISQDGEGNN